MSLASLCVYCGSSPGNDPRFVDGARALGNAMARRQCALVYGGSRFGMMGAIADSVLEAGGRAIGILPHGLSTKEAGHPGLDELHMVDSMHQRKALMIEKSQGFVAMPGGMGTFEELCEVVTWSQLGIHQRPIGIYNLLGYFDPFLTFLDHAVESGFLKRSHRELLLVEDDPERLLDRMEGFTWPLTQIWMARDEI
ncbi:TIGR00730 family Rossman fold protein [Lujinxingia litoralis]|uniref:Cytokinin riboside 5'-monophosphate phosphoribohydrolase n=1 Tax=Lujinxingia litoralis TaxID=2211119 RepID=A0A328CAB7_9DELT|nr:TIGR00730 family Rossman fold protein [Lujinxingia litoralis]RAL22803.1 TIGR00730 family Rossman fold protein [Lujinxingia litoralis]